MSLAFFDILYYDLFMKRDEQTLNKEVAFIQKLLPFQNGGIIDFCCGVGDLLATFQKRGWETQGVEWVPEYVQLAKEQFKVSVKCGDALKIEIGIQADVCLNWFSSFGYFTKENGMRLLQNMVKHLKPGGVLILETYHSLEVIRHFQEELTYKKQYKGQELEIVRRSELELAARNLKQIWTIGSEQREMTTHLYFQDELVEMCEALGLKDIRIYDSTGRENLSTPTINSKRLVLSAVKG